MKKVNIKFKNFFKKVRKFTKMNPHKHWDVIIKVLFFSIFILILFSLFILYQIKNDQMTQYNKNEVKESVIIINEDKLNRVDSYFEDKTIKIEDIKSNPFPYKDPSN